MPKKVKLENNNLETKPKKGRIAKNHIVIDHPKNNEEITYKAHYAIRISAPNNGIVEVKFNDGEYQKCRNSAGYWWFDWSNIPSGRYEIVCRLVDPQKNRTLKKSEKIFCIVK